MFTTQEAFQEAFKAGELDRDVVVVVRQQGPQANGMPELHKLTPPLGVLMDRGYKVALVTDGRMSGASGKIPAAIQLTPEAAVGGPLGRVRDGDVVRLDADDRNPGGPGHRGGTGVAPAGGLPADEPRVDRHGPRAVRRAAPYASDRPTAARRCSAPSPPTTSPRSPTTSPTAAHTPIYWLRHHR